MSPAPITSSRSPSASTSASTRGRSRALPAGLIEIPSRFLRANRDHPRLLPDLYPLLHQFSQLSTEQQQQLTQAKLSGLQLLSAEQLAELTSTEQQLLAAPMVTVEADAGDAPDAVAVNRGCLRTAIAAEPVFLQQVHGVAVAELDRPATSAGVPVADACLSAATGQACTIMVADCLPVLFCDTQGTWVAAAHAGWPAPIC